jgi:hypothetical protein
MLFSVITLGSDSEEEDVVVMTNQEDLQDIKRYLGIFQNSIFISVPIVVYNGGHRGNSV